ncbi:hypothetical protein NEOLI_004145 [Neolecta irregularis DAH-3]|uniref:Uncharacterized protein n=1 Tax=Neolecta irregularis (strain DAH-3) TaxID=1198029 RepID=A0A1U7LLX5_NEOID|nr:hypothetical protein NEOLI_004145 [Neolecta irregularis DAH-3]|eukprot:OLL23666.1 hypothetical protein NEOLI_004145 [Neolecta irregularis DAH-3]
MTNLGRIEFFHITRPAPPRHSSDDPRWRPEWNGRENFKRFRKPGAPPPTATPKLRNSLIPVKPYIARESQERIPLDIESPSLAVKRQTTQTTHQTTHTTQTIAPSRSLEAPLFAPHEDDSDDESRFRW